MRYANEKALQMAQYWRSLDYQHSTHLELFYECSSPGKKNTKSCGFNFSPFLNILINDRGSGVQIDPVFTTH